MICDLISWGILETFLRFSLRISLDGKRYFLEGLNRNNFLKSPSNHQAEPRADQGMNLIIIHHQNHEEREARFQTLR